MVRGALTFKDSKTYLFFTRTANGERSPPELSRSDDARKNACLAYELPQPSGMPPARIELAPRG
jgi:hypothetical protein